MIAQALAEGYNPSVIIYNDNLGDALKSFDLVVAVMAAGIIVRKICQHLKNKWEDTPVVAVSSSLSCAVPIIGGHHGANELALFLSEKLRMFPAITTATEASGRQNLEGVAEALSAEIINRESSKDVNLAFLREDVPVLRLKGPKIVVVDYDVAVLKSKGLVVGLGARKGVGYDEVLQAIDSALKTSGRKRDEVRIIATAWLKRDEKGISDAAAVLGRDVIYLPENVLNAQEPTTPSRANDLGLSGVAESAVLALANRLVMPKKAYGRVTVALGE